MAYSDGYAGGYAGDAGGGSGTLPADRTVWEYGDTLLVYLQEQGATVKEVTGALNELNGTEGIEFDLAYRTYFGIS